MKVTYIDPNEMATQCNSVNDELKQQNQVLQEIDDVIIQAIKEEGLQGLAWNGIKELFTNHDAFIKLIIFANEKLIQAMGKEVLDRRQIEGNISSLQSSIVNNQKIITTYKNKTDTIKKPSITDLMRGNVQTINMNLKAIEHLRKKIETMDSIEGNTANLYKEAAHLYELAEKGIEILKDSWNGSTYRSIQPHDIFRKTWAVSILKLVSDTKQKEKDLAKMIGNEPAELTNEIEKLRRQYEKGEITEDEVISKLLKGYGVDEYISQPSYSAAFGKKYNPEKKRELVGKVAMALVYVKGGEAYIEEQYKEYEKRYSNNYYDRNKLTHNTSYGVLPVDNPPKIPREEYFKQLVVDEMENVGKQAYSQEKLENDLIKLANAIVAGILVQRAYNKYGQAEKPSVEDVPQTKGNDPGVLEEPELETENTNGFGGSDASKSGNYSSSPMTVDDWHNYFNEKYGADNVTWENASIQDIVDMASKITDFSPKQISDLAIKSGWSVEPLGKGSLAGVPYERGGGLSMHAPNGSSVYIQYHLGGGHHGEMPYYKVSSAKNGIIRGRTY